MNVLYVFYTNKNLVGTNFGFKSSTNVVREMNEMGFM